RYARAPTGVNRGAPGNGPRRLRVAGSCDCIVLRNGSVIPGSRTRERWRSLGMPMTEGEYLRQLHGLLSAEVPGRTRAEQLSAARRLVEAAAAGGDSGPPAVDFVPFVTGRRPVVEAHRPGLGSSDHAALLLHGGGTNRAYLLYEVRNLPPEGTKEG